MGAPPVFTSRPGAVADHCRSCHEPGLELVLDLGLQPVADWLVRPDHPDSDASSYPLTLMMCRRCLLLQLAAFDGEEGVRGHRHESSLSSTRAAHASASATGQNRCLSLGTARVAGVVVEEDGGGGGVARALGARGVRVVAADRCAPRIADVVVANHSLAHSPDLRRAVTELVALLVPGGSVAVEFHHGARMLMGTQFDLICHPHRLYLSLAALVEAFEQHGFSLSEAAELPVHGGSVRVYAREGHRTAGATMARLLAVERDELSSLRQFAGRVNGASKRVRTFLEQARAVGKTVLGYGAPSRASTLLNHCQVTRELLPATVDRSIAKQGWALPGCRVPIHSPSLLSDVKPDFVLVLAWTLAEEIMDQMAHVRSWGGRFVVPLPEFRVLP